MGKSVRRHISAVVLMVASTIACVTVMAWPAPDLSGQWDLEFAFDDAADAGGGIDCTFTQTAERLTGNCMAEALSGEVKGRRVTWQMKAGQTKETIAFTGTVNDAGTSISGKFSMPGKGGSFTATKR